MSAPAPLRHYFAPLEPSRRPDACRCGRPRADAVHLTPGDDAAQLDAIRAANPNPPPNTQRTPEQSEAAITRATKRNAARWTFGTSGTSAHGPHEAG